MYCSKLWYVNIIWTRYPLIVCVDIYLRDRLARYWHVKNWAKLYKCDSYHQWGQQRACQSRGFMAILVSWSWTPSRQTMSHRCTPCRERPSHPSRTSQHQEHGPHHNHSARHKQSAVDKGQVWTGSYRPCDWHRDSRVNTSAQPVSPAHPTHMELSIQQSIFEMTLLLTAEN